MIDDARWVLWVWLRGDWHQHARYARLDDAWDEHDRLAIMFVRSIVRRHSAPAR